MSWMEFASSVVNALAWPTCIFLVIFLLRRGFVNMLTSGPLKLLKAGPSGLEMEYFDRTLTDAKLNAEGTKDKSQPDKETGVEIQDSLYSDLRTLAMLEPRQAILGSFRRLERFLRAKLLPAMSPAARDHIGKGVDIPLLTGYAVGRGVLTDAQGQSFKELLTLSQALERRPAEDLVDTERALTYIDVVANLTRSINDAELPLMEYKKNRQVDPKATPDNRQSP